MLYLFRYDKRNKKVFDLAFNLNENIWRCWIVHTQIKYMYLLYVNKYKFIYWTYTEPGNI